MQNEQLFMCGFLNRLRYRREWTFQSFGPGGGVGRAAGATERAQRRSRPLFSEVVGGRYADAGSKDDDTAAQGLERALARLEALEAQVNVACSQIVKNVCYFFFVHAGFLRLLTVAI